MAIMRIYTSWFLSLKVTTKIEAVLSSKIIEEKFNILVKMKLILLSFFSRL